MEVLCNPMKKQSVIREGEAGMTKRREDGQIGIFSFCLPVDISLLPVVARTVGLTQRRKDAKSGQEVHFSSNSA